jgi:uncharacterized protein (TIGR02391 family)
MLKKFEMITRKASSFTSKNFDKEINLHPFDERNIHPSIVELTKKLFDDGHYSQATFEAFKYIDKEIQGITSTNKSGYKLMMDTFNEISPKIKLTNLSNQSEIDEQQGYKFIFTGSVLAIRNPRGHEYKIKESLNECLDHLSFASLLKRRIDGRVA